VHPATALGFAACLEEANKVSVDGYELVTIVRLESHIAAVFQKRTSQASDSFFE
jgi:hypothetical protein